jgi:hypothetical protein
VDKNSGKLHPLMTVTALAVIAAALATIAVLTGVLPDRLRPADAAPGAAVAAFAKSLAASPIADAPTSPCGDCATVVSSQAAGNGQWQVAVRMDDGNRRLFSVEGMQLWQVGDRVRISNGIIMSM